MTENDKEQEIIIIPFPSEKDLFEAIKDGSYEKLENLLKEVNPNFRAPSDHRMTPLEYAVFHNRIDILKLLLENGAKVNWCSFKDDRSLLDFARRHGKFEDRPKVEDLLRSYGAKTILDIRRENKFTFFKKKEQWLLIYECLEDKFCMSQRTIRTTSQDEKGKCIETEGKTISFKKLQDFISLFRSEKELKLLDPCHLYIQREERFILWAILYEGNNIIIEKVGYFEHDVDLPVMYMNLLNVDWVRSSYIHEFIKCNLGIEVLFEGYQC